MRQAVNLADLRISTPPIFGANWTLPTPRDTLSELFKFSGCRSLAEFTAIEEDHLSKWR
jgi:hypothetical protein